MNPFEFQPLLFCHDSEPACRVNGALALTLFADKFEQSLGDVLPFRLGFALRFAPETEILIALVCVLVPMRIERSRNLESDVVWVVKVDAVDQALVVSGADHGYMVLAQPVGPAVDFLAVGSLQC